MTAEQITAAMLREWRNGPPADGGLDAICLKHITAALANATCSNAPCPKCGGGPSGEWSEGSEVQCDDCGVDLAVVCVVPCMGSSRFVLAYEDDEATP